jgi:hypothetical protein
MDHVQGDDGARDGGRGVRPGVGAHAPGRGRAMTVTSSWVRTAYRAPYRLPPAPMVFEVYRRPLTGGWWLQVLDRGGLPLRVPVDCTRPAFLSAVGRVLGEYHLLPTDADTGRPSGGIGPAWVRVRVDAATRAPVVSLASSSAAPRGTP